MAGRSEIAVKMLSSLGFPHQCRPIVLGLYFSRARLFSARVQDPSQLRLKRPNLTLSRGKSLRLLRINCPVPLSLLSLSRAPPEIAGDLSQPKNILIQV